VYLFSYQGRAETAFLFIIDIFSDYGFAIDPLYIIVRCLYICLKYAHKIA